MQQLSNYIQNLNATSRSPRSNLDLNSNSNASKHRARARTSSMSSYSVKTNGNSDTETTTNKSQTISKSTPASAAVLHIAVGDNINDQDRQKCDGDGNNINTDTDTDTKETKHTDKSSNVIGAAMADTMTLDIGTRMLICVFFALLSSLIISVLFQRVSVDRSHTMSMIFTISLVIDSIINSLCLILQWEFSDKLYYTLCRGCDSCVKWYYLTRIFPRKSYAPRMEIKINVVKKDKPKRINKPGTCSNKSERKEIDIQRNKNTDESEK